MSERPTRLHEETDTVDFAPPQQHQPPAVRQPAVEPQASALPSRSVPFAPATASFGKVVEAIAGVMAEIQPVAKLGFNKFHNYAHMRIGDLNAELTPLMGKHGIVVIQNESRRDVFDGGAVVAVQYEFTILHKSGEVYPERPVITGVARCRTTKESWDDKTFNKCHTAARKYFLIGLFQIPVSDEDDADADHGSDGMPRQQQRPTRRPPSPDGKATPDVIPVIDGEHPTAWIDRFKKAVSQSDSPATITKWYNANLAIFEKMKRFKDEQIDGLKLFESVVSFMDDLEVKLTKPKDDPITSGPQPGSPALDREVAQEEEPKPRQQRRRAPPPAEIIDDSGTKAELAKEADEARLWLESLENAFAACEDASQLSEAVAKHMTPRLPEFTSATQGDAKRKMREHLARIEGGAA